MRFATFKDAMLLLSVGRGIWCGPARPYFSFCDEVMPWQCLWRIGAARRNQLAAPCSPQIAFILMLHTPVSSVAADEVGWFDAVCGWLDGDVVFGEDFDCFSSFCSLPMQKEYSFFFDARAVFNFL